MLHPIVVVLLVVIYPLRVLTLRLPLLAAIVLLPLAVAIALDALLTPQCDCQLHASVVSTSIVAAVAESD